MNDTNFIIRVLKWATLQEEFTFQQLCKAVLLSEKEQEQLKRLIHDKSLLFHSHTSFYSSVARPGSDIKLFASAEDHFRFLEYVELNEARESAKDANRKALFAIWIAILSTVVSIFLSILSIESDLNIPDKLYSTINKTNKSVVGELTEIKNDNHELKKKLISNSVCLINTDPTYK